MNSGFSIFIQFSLLGLGAGAVYVLLAQGIVLIYRGSGVVNFAHGAFAMVGAFLFITVHQNHGWAFIPSLVLVIVAGVLLGLLTHFAVLRRLRNASTLSRVIATLGILLTVQAVGVLVWGSGAVFVEAFLPQGSLNLGGGLFAPEDRLILAGFALVVTVLLWLMYRFTTVGISMRAAAENTRGIGALGWSADALAGLTWGLGGALAAVAGMLIAPLTGAVVPDITLLIIPALAAVLIGRFQSLPLVLLGGMAIGVAQSDMSHYVSVQGLSDSLPFGVIIVVLAIRGTSLPVRGYVADRFASLGTGEIRTKPAGLVVTVLGLLAAFVFSPALDTALTTSMVYAIVLLSIVVITGYAGQLSLAQFAFGGMAALISARLMAGAGFSFVPALVIGVLATVPIGLLFGLPALRTRGVSLAAVTLGLGLAAQDMIFSNPNIIGGGGVGTAIGNAKVFGLSVDTATHANRYAVLVLVLFVACLVGVASIRRGRAGRRLIAVKTNERAAAALGISVVGAKLYAFGLAAAIAGLGGALIGFQNSTVTFDAYTPTNSIYALGFAVIGGVGYILGPVFGMMFAAGGLAAYIFDPVFSAINTWIGLIGGVSLLFILLQDPNGMASAHLTAGRRLLKLVRRRQTSSAAPAAAEPLAEVAERGRVKAATLVATGITVRFGGVTAVNNVSVSVSPGEIVGLIGPNGAGKTTFIDAVTGFVRPSAGEVRLGDQRIDGWAVHRRARAGLSRSFQSLELFDDVSVRENLRAASDTRDRMAYITNLLRPGNKPLPAAAVAAVREFGLERELELRPTDLPYGRRRLVAVARAVASEPSILLLDEPAAGLDEQETRELAELVRGLARNWGIGVLVVEHDMSFVMTTCDRLTVLDFGATIASGATLDVRDDPNVIAAYLGEPADSINDTAATEIDNRVQLSAGDKRP
jgi:ABC-type branched-subunit amino acid transport system ATPase component/branched-subunit amino acid ABC-type transport system permease component